MDTRESPATAVGWWLVIATILVVPLCPPHYHGVILEPHVFGVLSVAAVLAVAAGSAREGSFARRLRCTPTMLGFALLLLGALLSTPFARVEDAARKALLFPAGMLALHTAASTLPISRRRTTTVLLLSLCGAVAIATYGILGYVEFRAQLAAGQVVDADRSRLLSTPFFEHSYLAAQATLPLLLVAAGLAGGSTGKVRVALAVLSAPVIFFIALVLSRASWVAALVGLAAIAVGGVLAARAARPRGWGTLLMRIGVGFALFGLLLAGLTWAGVFGDDAAQSVARRFSSLFDPRLAAFNFSRLVLWGDSLRMLCDHLPVGVGPGNFAFEIGFYDDSPKRLTHAHNQTLHTLAELGVVGTLGLALVMIHPLCAAFTALKRPELGSGRVAVLLGAIGGLVSIITFGLVESPLQFTTPAATYAVLSGVVMRLSDLALPAGAGPRPGLRSPIVLASVLVLIAAVVSAPFVARHEWAGHLGYRASKALETGDLASARSLVEEAHAVAPQHVQVLLVEIAVLRAQGDAEQTVALNRALEALYPGLPSVPWDIGMNLMIHLKRPAEAIEPLRVARRRAHAQSRPYVTLMLATCLADSRQLEPARLLYHELLQENYHLQEPVVMLRLAEVLMNLGRDRAMASLLLNQYIKRSTPSEAIYAQRLLTDIGRYYTVERG